MRIYNKLVCVATFLAPCALITYGFNFTLSDSMFALALFFCPVLLYQDKKILGIRSTLIYLWIIGLFMFVCSLLLWSVFTSPEEGFIVCLQYVYSLLILPIIYFQSYRRINSITLIHIFICGMLFVAVYGLIFYIFFPQAIKGLMVGGRMGSLLGNPNIIAKLIGNSFPLTLYLYYKHYISKVSLLIHIIIFSGALIIAASFGGILTVILAIIIFLIISGKAFRGIIYGVLIVFILIYTVSQYRMLEVFQKRILYNIVQNNENMNSIGSASEKIGLIKEALIFISKDPIRGIGAGRYEVYSNYATQVHNSYLLIWVEGGVTALFGILMFILVFCIIGCKAIKHNLKYEGALLLAVTISFMFSCITNTHIYNRYYWIPIYLSTLPISEHLELFKKYKNKSKNSF